MAQNAVKLRKSMEVLNGVREVAEKKADDAREAKKAAAGRHLMASIAKANKGTRVFMA